MSEAILGLDPRGIEIIKQGLIWYYRAWSYYWREEPNACSIYAAESFVASEDGVVCFIPRDVTSEDGDRFREIFGVAPFFIAGELLSGQSGFSISTGRFEGTPNPRMQRLVNQIHRDQHTLSQEVGKRRKENRRQEWKLGQSGTYREFSDGFHKQLILTPQEGNPYAYSLIANRPGEWRFSTTPPETPDGPISKGDYRRHWNEVGRQRLENLDLFPEGGRPRLWRLAHVGTGFKITRREVPTPVLEQ